MLKPYFRYRNFTGRIQPGVRFQVNSMRWGARWGCLEASLTANGTELELWELVEFLRCPVEIYDEVGRLAWWGMVSEARIRVDAIEVGVTLDSMQNRLAVAYSYVTPGTQEVGVRKTTAWADNDESITEYGTKEFLSSMDGMSDAAAEARRDAILASRKWPQGGAGQFGSPRGRVRYSGAKRSLSASLLCKGWWSTLGWQYASIPSVTGPSYSSTTSTEQNVGETSSNPKVMQQVLVGTQAINVLELRVYGRKQASPTDNLVLALYELDASGDPTGSALGSVNIAGSGLSGSLGWITGTLSSELQLKANTLYGFQMSRSGAVDGTNYYVVNVNTGLGYSGGAFKIYNGSAWVARSPDADMPFVLQVDNFVESTEQIRDLATLFGEFITGVEVDAGSEVLLPSYRDGDTDTLQEIDALLEAGGVNGRRLLTSIDAERRLLVWEEEVNTTIGYYLESDGQIVDQAGAEVVSYTPPVGKWIKLRNVIPASVDTTKLIDPTLQFIEEATWSDSGGLQLQFRGQPSIEDMFKVKR